MDVMGTMLHIEAPSAEVRVAECNHLWSVWIDAGCSHYALTGTLDELERIGADIVAAVARARHEHEAQVAANPPLDLAGVSS